MNRLVLTGFLPVLFAAVCGAQNPTRILTESQYLSVLNEDHPAVRDATEAVTAAEASVLEASVFDNPVLNAVGEDPSGAIRQTDIVVSWQLPDTARVAQIEAGNSELEAARARFSQQLLNHRLAMKEAYANWAVAENRQRRLAAQLQRVAALAERETARSVKGEASGLEAHRLRLAATAFRSRVALATADVERARAEAAAWYAELSIEVHPVLPELPDAPSSGFPGSLERIAEAELTAAETAREAAGRFISSPELSLGWQRQEAGREVIDGPIFGLAWSVPVFDRKQAARKAADARIDGARARLEVIERSAEATRRAAQEGFSHLSLALTEARGELEGNDRMLDGAEASFRHGETSVTDLLETHRSVTEAELAILDLHEAALAAHREWERLTGATKPSPARRGPASPNQPNDHESTDLLTEENTP